MEICEIRSRQLSFRSGTLSAEHVSLRFLDEDIDYVWQPRPGHWEHGSFLCFPLLGRLPEGRYCLDGRTYDCLLYTSQRTQKDVGCPADLLPDPLLIRRRQMQSGKQLPYRCNLAGQRMKKDAAQIKKQFHEKPLQQEF